MKIAVSSAGKETTDNVAELFGRCPYFIMAEIENNKVGKTEIIKNESVDQASGAGMTAAKLIVENGASAVIAKNVGPRALDVLKQFDITVYNGDGKVEDVLQEFIYKKLKKI